MEQRAMITLTRAQRGCTSAAGQEARRESFPGCGEPECTGVCAQGNKTEHFTRLFCVLRNWPVEICYYKDDGAIWRTEQQV